MKLYENKHVCAQFHAQPGPPKESARRTKLLISYKAFAMNDITILHKILTILDLRKVNVDNFMMSSKTNFFSNCLNQAFIRPIIDLRYLP